MVLLLFTLALVALTVVALLFAGVLIAVVTGVALFNVLALILGMRTHRLRTAAAPRGRWQPSSFRRPPEPPFEEPEEQDRPALTIHRREA